MSKTLKIDPEFRSLISPLRKEEYSQLRQSLKTEGCRDALVVWKGLILDGHHRYKICRRHGIEFEVKEISLKSRIEAKRWIILNQIARRNLNLYLRVKTALQLEPFIAKRAEKRKKEAGKLYGKGHPKREKVLLEKIKPIDTEAEVAKVAGVSKSTVYMVKRLLKYIQEEEKDWGLKRRLERGEMTINKAFSNRIRPDELRKTMELLFNQFEKDKDESTIPYSLSWHFDRLLSYLKNATNEIKDIQQLRGNWLYKAYYEEGGGYRHLYPLLISAYGRLERIMKEIRSKEAEPEVKEAIKKAKDMKKKVDEAVKKLES